MLRPGDVVVMNDKYYVLTEDKGQGWNDGIEAVIENAPIVIPSNKEDAE